MGINASWEATLAFQDFRDKTHELSRVYWTQQMSADSLISQLNTQDPNAISAQVIACSFDPKMHSQKVSDTVAWIPEYMSRNRLHLLVLYTSFLESYLKEITFFHCCSLGYVGNPEETKKPLKLTAVGGALSSPIIKSSTVPDMIDYASEYYDIDFGDRPKEWTKIYKVRCAAAHNGGIATPKFLQAISGQPLALMPKAYDTLGLTWDELRTYMRYGDEIAALIDQKASVYQLRILEADEVLREINAKKMLPIDYNKLWQFLNDDYGIRGIKKKEKHHFVRKFYNVII